MAKEMTVVWPFDRARPGSTTLLVLLVLLVGTGCHQGEHNPLHSDSSQTVDEATVAIVQQSKRLSEAYVGGDIEALVDIYTPDGVAAPGGSDFVQGRSALLDLWALPDGRTVLHHKATAVEIVVDGDHAYDRGYYEGQVAQDGEPRGSFKGTYVIVWERGEDGIWRIDVDMWHGLPAQDS